MENQEELARRRLEILNLAQTLGNVSEACRQTNISRKTFYKYKTRFESDGMDGLRDRSPVHKTHPWTTPPETVNAVIAISYARPDWGCRRISRGLAGNGVFISPPTVQSILQLLGRATLEERWLDLERKASAKTLTQAQIAFLEQRNPCFRARHQETERPGQLLDLDIFSIRYYQMCVVIDTYCSYAFVSTEQVTLESVPRFLDNNVLPFYRERGLTVGTILTLEERDFSYWWQRIKDARGYRRYLEANGIEHRTKPRTSPEHGFLERFKREVGRIDRQSYGGHLRDPQQRWLSFYNTEQPHLGYRNMGQTPMERIEEYVTNEA